jgi:hypothetical protein
MAFGCEQRSLLRKNRGLYDSVIAHVQAGALATNRSEPFQLPQEFAEASVDGEIYVSRPSTNQILVVFKTWRGKGRNMEGLLYASPTLPKQLLNRDTYGHSVVLVGGAELVVEKEMERNWYKVSYRLD